MRAHQTEELEKYAIYLRECSNAMLGLGRLSELEHHSSMRLIVERLPIHAQRKWIAEDTDTLQKTGSPASFEKLVNFIERQSLIVNNPRYKTQNQSQGKDAKPVGVKRTTFATSTSSTGGATGHSAGNDKKECGFCNRGGHTAYSCRNLEAKSHEEKMAWLKSNRYCFSCIRQGHRSDSCTNKSTCRQCQGRHPTILHRNKSESGNQEDRTRVISGTNSSNQASGAGQRRDDTRQHESKGNKDNTAQISSGVRRIGAGQRIGMSVLPVRLRSQDTGREMKTLAFLDSGSSASFCTDTVCSQLGIRGRPTRVCLSTMASKEESVDMKLVRNLDIKGLDAAAEPIQIPSLFVYKEMPINRKEVATVKDIHRWDHLSFLKDVPIGLPNSDLEIGLLLGNDIPDFPVISAVLVCFF